MEEENAVKKKEFLSIPDEFENQTCIGQICGT